MKSIKITYYKHGGYTVGVKKEKILEGEHMNKIKQYWKALTFEQQCTFIRESSTTLMLLSLTIFALATSGKR